MTMFTVRKPRLSSKARELISVSLTLIWKAYIHLRGNKIKKMNGKYETLWKFKQFRYNLVFSYLSIFSIALFVIVYLRSIWGTAQYFGWKITCLLVFFAELIGRHLFPGNFWRCIEEIDRNLSRFPRTLPTISLPHLAELRSGAKRVHAQKKAQEKYRNYVQEKLHGKLTHIGTSLSSSKEKPHKTPQVGTC